MDVKKFDFSSDKLGFGDHSAILPSENFILDEPLVPVAKADLSGLFGDFNTSDQPNGEGLDFPEPV